MLASANRTASGRLMNSPRNCCFVSLEGNLFFSGNKMEPMEQFCKCKALLTTIFHLIFRKDGLHVFARSYFYYIIIIFSEPVKLGSSWKCIVGCAIHCLKWSLFVVCPSNLTSGIWTVPRGSILLNSGWACLAVNS